MTAPARFRLLRRFLGPKWLTEGEAGLIGYALDLLKDGAVERARLALLARFPQNDPTGQTTAPADALIAMSRDRRIIQGISETSVQYAARLLTWLDEHKTRGNPFTLMRQLAAYVGTGSSFRIVDNSGNWYARDASGVQTSSLQLSNWNWDGDSSKWSRFWVVIYPGSVWAVEGTWGSGGLWGDGGMWGATITQEQAASLRAIITDWKPAGTSAAAIISFSTSNFLPSAPEPDGSWGKWEKYSGGVAVATRLSTGRYTEAL